MAMTLKAARTNRNFTQEQAAERIGVSVDCLSNYERGKTYPNVPIIKRIEDAYGIEYKDIIFCPEIMV